MYVELYIMNNHANKNLRDKQAVEMRNVWEKVGSLLMSDTIYNHNIVSSDARD